MLKLAHSQISFHLLPPAVIHPYLFPSPSLRTHLIILAGWIHGYWIKHPKSNKQRRLLLDPAGGTGYPMQQNMQVLVLCYPKYSRQPRDQPFTAGIRCHIYASFSIPFTKKSIFCWFSLFFNALCLWAHTCKGQQGHTNCTWHWPLGVWVQTRNTPVRHGQPFFLTKQNRCLASFYIHVLKDSSVRHYYVTRAEISHMPRRSWKSSPPRPESLL